MEGLVAVHSPKFPLKRKDIEEVVSRSRLKLIWKAKVREAMKRQLVPDPLEHLDFHTKLDPLCAAIEAEVSSGNYIPSPPVRLLVEKSKGLCRQIVIPTVKDALILQVLSDALWATLKGNAPSKNAFYAPNDHSFSRREKNERDEYGPLKVWLKFQEAILGFSERKSYVVITDIANFYDFISHDHLRNILAELSGAKEHALDLLIHTLSHMQWQPDYMPRVPTGLPQIDLDAPRLLAHCFLFEIDRLLVNTRGAEYARYMDDIDIGVDTLPAAKRVLRDLDLALQTRQVRLNSGKTRILTAAQAARHYRVRENRFLDDLENSIETKIASGDFLAREDRFVSSAISRGFRTDAFTSGNGEKVLKRCLSIARKVGAVIEPEMLTKLLTGWPSVRAQALAWWRQSPNAHLTLPAICEVIEAKEFVDDSAIITIAGAVVTARLPQTEAVTEAISRMIAALDTSEIWPFHATLWLQSKYGSTDVIMQTIERRVSLWVTQECLSRLVAGMFPRLSNQASRLKHFNIIRRYGSRWSLDVLAFHQGLSKGSNGWQAIKRFVEALNPSFPNGLTHAKFLMILSLLQNSDIGGPTRKLIEIHREGLTDPHYSLWLPEEVREIFNQGNGLRPPPAASEAY